MSLSLARSLARSLFAQVMDHFEDFYEDVFEELVKFGELRSLNVCDNEAFHLAGNVYAVFRDEDAAAKALEAMNCRYYAGKPILAEFSPVTEIREAVCRQYDERGCTRGGNCNFMHLKRIGRSLRDQLFGSSRGRSPPLPAPRPPAGAGKRASCGHTLERNTGAQRHTHVRGVAYAHVPRLVGANRRLPLRVSSTWGGVCSSVNAASRGSNTEGGDRVFRCQRGGRARAI